MTVLLYVSHPQVAIDPAVPVTAWGLSEEGRRRAEAAARSPWLAGVRGVVSSTEAKAAETAAIFAQALNLRAELREGLHENDRSATGYLPPAAFEAAADAFFAHPEASVRGWERAVDAQPRIVAGIGAVLREAPEGDVLVAGHGGVGTLLWCHAAGLPVSRAYDQPAGGGSYLVIDRASGRGVRGWRPIEEL